MPYVYGQPMAYSGQRKIAFDTGFNDALFGRARDNPYKLDVVGGSHKAYEEGYGDGLLSDVPPRGPRGEQGPAGLPGATGSPGSPGTAGTSGASIRTGSGAPGVELGYDGDVYIDGDNGDIWSKSGGTWSLSGSAREVSIATRTDTVDPNATPEITYRGDAPPGTASSAAAWRVRKITIAADGDVTIEYADGNDLYDNIWDNRLALSYS